MPLIVPVERNTVMGSFLFSSYKDVTEVGDNSTHVNLTSDFFILQVRKDGKHSDDNRRAAYRIITKGDHPFYIVAYGNKFSNILSNEWRFLTEDFTRSMPKSLDLENVKSWIVASVTKLCILEPSNELAIHYPENSNKYIVGTDSSYKSSPVYGALNDNSSLADTYLGLSNTVSLKNDSKNCQSLHLERTPFIPTELTKIDDFEKRKFQSTRNSSQSSKANDSSSSSSNNTRPLDPTLEPECHQSSKEVYINPPMQSLRSSGSSRISGGHEDRFRDPSHSVNVDSIASTFNPHIERVSSVYVQSEGGSCPESVQFRDQKQYQSNDQHFLSRPCSVQQQKEFTSNSQSTVSFPYSHQPSYYKSSPPVTPNPLAFRVPTFAVLLALLISPLPTYFVLTRLDVVACRMLLGLWLITVWLVFHRTPSTSRIVIELTDKAVITQRNLAKAVKAIEVGHIESDLIPPPSTHLSHISSNDNSLQHTNGSMTTSCAKNLYSSGFEAKPEANSQYSSVSSFPMFSSKFGASTAHPISSNVKSSIAAGVSSFPLITPENLLSVSNLDYQRDPTVPSERWSSELPETFKVRQQGYLTNKLKAACEDLFYESIGVDVFTSPSKIDHLTSRSTVLLPPMLRSALRVLPKDKPIPSHLLAQLSELVQPTDDLPVPPYMIVTFQFPDYAPSLMGSVTDGSGYTLVFHYCLYGEQRKKVTELYHRGHPGARLLAKFAQSDLSSTKTSLKGRFKGIPIIQNLEEHDMGFIVNNTLAKYNATPFLTGPVHQRWYQGRNYLEVNVDVHEYCYAARKGASACIGFFSSMVLSMAFLIEARDEEDLPEALVGATTLRNIQLHALSDAENVFPLGCRMGTTLDLPELVKSQAPLLRSLEENVPENMKEPSSPKPVRETNSALFLTEKKENLEGKGEDTDEYVSTILHDSASTSVSIDTLSPLLTATTLWSQSNPSLSLNINTQSHSTTSSLNGNANPSQTSPQKPEPRPPALPPSASNNLSQKPSYFRASSNVVSQDGRKRSSKKIITPENQQKSSASSSVDIASDNDFKGNLSNTFGSNLHDSDLYLSSDLTQLSLSRERSSQTPNSGSSMEWKRSQPPTQVSTTFYQSSEQYQSREHHSKHHRRASLNSVSPGDLVSSSMVTQLNINSFPDFESNSHHIKDKKSVGNTRGRSSDTFSPQNHLIETSELVSTRSSGNEEENDELMNEHTDFVSDSLNGLSSETVLNHRNKKRTQFVTASDSGATLSLTGPTGTIRKQPHQPSDERASGEKNGYGPNGTIKKPTVLTTPASFSIKKKASLN